MFTTSVSGAVEVVFTETGFLARLGLETIVAEERSRRVARRERKRKPDFMFAVCVYGCVGVWLRKGLVRKEEGFAVGGGLVYIGCGFGGDGSHVRVWGRGTVLFRERIVGRCFVSV